MFSTANYIYLLVHHISIGVPNMEQIQNPEFCDKPRKLYTLIYPIDFEKGTIVQGYKKRGFGVGKCMYQCFFPEAYIFLTLLLPN